MKSAVVLFPGSNRERDAARALKQATGQDATIVWHGETALPDRTDIVVLPGGFSYGDYLRCGAIAARSPIMDKVRERAAKGVNVLGVCNGFQILIEAGLLPGALMRNEGLNFVCRDVALEVANDRSAFTAGYQAGERITVPVAHHDGNYVADADTLDRLEGEGQVAFRYAEAVNGSARGIAGLLNAKGNVLGMMPHPERRVEPAHGGTDGRRLFEGLLAAVA